MSQDWIVTLSVLHLPSFTKTFLVVTAVGKHPFPSRTRPLSRPRRWYCGKRHGRVGRRQDPNTTGLDASRRRALFDSSPVFGPRGRRVTGAAFGRPWRPGPASAGLDVSPALTRSAVGRLAPGLSSLGLDATRSLPHGPRALARRTCVPGAGVHPSAGGKPMPATGWTRLRSREARRRRAVQGSAARSAA